MERLFATPEPQRTERHGAPLRGVENRPTAAGSRSRRWLGSSGPGAGIGWAAGGSRRHWRISANAARDRGGPVYPLRGHAASKSPRAAQSAAASTIGKFSQARHRCAAQGERIRSTLSAATRDRGKTLRSGCETAAPPIRLRRASHLVAEPMPAVVRIIPGADAIVSLAAQECFSAARRETRRRSPCAAQHAPHEWRSFATPNDRS